VERRDDTARKLLAIAKAATNTPSTMIENPHKQLPETPAIHLTAFVLNPENVTHAISGDETRHILEFLDRHGNSASLRAQFGQYRTQKGCFAPSAPAWVVKSVAIEFWTEIGRLLHTPANSVPSERSFSTRNLAQAVKRNFLKPST
jgi:hypothetical protein